MVRLTSVKLDSQNLCRVTKVKDLGVLIDNDLQFKNHTLSKIKTAYRITGLVRRNFKNNRKPIHVVYIAVGNYCK